MKKLGLGVWAALASLIILVLAVFGVVIVGGGSTINNTSDQTSVSQNQTLAIKVVSAASLEKDYNYDFNLQNTDSLLTVFNTLDSSSDEFSVEYADFSFGKMITTVNGYTTKDNEFWNIKINGADAQVGISELKIAPGDKVELILTSF